jgi:glycosyltransferase involved in cell wall biosynthesis
MIERIPTHPPEIKPVPENIQRPRWSVMIPAYNCSQYLIENILSVLQQDPGPLQMQIEVVDDSSTDTDVEALVKEAGKGRVGYYRQPENVGSLRNFETCLNRATGHYIHILHGDDKLRNGFYNEIEKLFAAFPEAGAAFTGFTFIDEKISGYTITMFY